MQLFRRHWFLASLLLSLLGGYAFSNVAQILADSSFLKWSIVFSTMFLMAWPIRFSSLRETFFRPLAPVLASLLNIGVIPLLVWPFSKLVGDDLGAGMLVAAATPCTLASAAVWTRRAGGNDAVAILVTLLTNGSCFLVMPFWLYLQTGESVSPSALTGTIYKLLFFVVLPMGLAQFARIHRSSAAWATENKPLVSTLALFGILSMVFLGSVNMTIRLQQSDSGFAWMAFLNSSLILTLVHCMIFWGGMGLAKTMRIPKAERIAVGFAGSQKTLMIGLSVAINLGVSILPIIVYHAVQLIIDTVFADWIREQHGDAALHEGKCR